MTHLSPSQEKALATRRTPYRHAMDRLKERHFPDLDDNAAEELVLVMTDLCRLCHTVGNTKTASLVNVEAENSVIMDLDMFEDRKKIRVCFDPTTKQLRTVFPAEAAQ